MLDYRHTLHLKIPFPIFFCLALLQAISLGGHNVMIQARCCPAYSISSFWISGCTFWVFHSTIDDQLQLTCRPCTAMYHPSAFIREKFMGCPFANLSKWRPVPIWSSGSKAELPDWQGSGAGNCREKRSYGAKWQPWAFFPIASL